MPHHCSRCGSAAINHHLHGRDGKDPNLCDVCYWRARAERYTMPPLSAQLCRASHESLVAIRSLARHAMGISAKRSAPCPENALMSEIAAIADTAHNLPYLAINPMHFAPEKLAALLGHHNSASPLLPHSYTYWHFLERLCDAKTAAS